MMSVATEASFMLASSSVLCSLLTSAELQNRAAVPLALEGAAEEFPRLEHLWVDQGYTGTGKAWIEEHLGWSVEVVKHPPKPQDEWQPRGDLDDLSRVYFEWVRLPAEPKRFRGPLPRRWVAERTIGWLSQSRRMSKGYERLCESSQTMSRLMLRRLARV
jgi:putative transposase